jgi:hypothetical protein
MLIGPQVGAAASDATKPYPGYVKVRQSSHPVAVKVLVSAVTQFWHPRVGPAAGDEWACQRSRVGETPAAACAAAWAAGCQGAEERAVNPCQSGRGLSRRSTVTSCRSIRISTSSDRAMQRQPAQHAGGRQVPESKGHSERPCWSGVRVAAAGVTPSAAGGSHLGRPVSSTICTVSALNCGLNRRRHSGMNTSSLDQEDLFKIVGAPQRPPSTRPSICA